MIANKKNSKNILERIGLCEDFWIVIVSVFFGFIMSRTNYGNDDIIISNELGSKISYWWSYNIQSYFTWTSRIIINFIWFIVLKCGRFALFVYCGISMYVMIKALMLLFSSNGENWIKMYIIVVVLLFPFDTLYSAGWVATTTSYFGPQAFALMSLVPIKKIFNDEKISFKKLILYSICLIYGANAEQMNVVLFAAYLAVVIWSFIQKKHNWKIDFLFLLTVLSLINLFVCPGNQSRKDKSISAYFPTYGMLSTVDKADIGLSTTLKWMFAGNNAFIIVTCIMFAFLIWKKYKEPLFRFVAIIPAAATLLLGPFRSFLSAVFPYVAYAADDVDYYGSFTVEYSGSGRGMVQFGLFLVLAVCVCVEIFLLNDSVAGLITDFVLILAGVASRAAMGFSPSVYESSTRTYTSLVVCIMAVSVHLFSINVKYVGQNEKSHVFEYIMLGVILIGIVNFIFLVGTTFC